MSEIDAQRGPQRLFDLSGRVAIITGASSGLGAHFARVLADAGASVVLAARRLDRIDALAAEISASGGRALAIATDISIAADCSRLMDAVASDFGRLDVLVNNAGITSTGVPENDPVEEMKQVFQVNVLGGYALALRAAQNMTAGGSIINLSSVMAFRPAGFPAPAYATSKAAVIALTQQLSLQFADKGIRVNAIAPGFFPTEITEGERGRFLAKVFSATTVLRRAGRLGELSGALLLLASDASSYMTGLTLPVDGGWVFT